MWLMWEQHVFLWKKHAKKLAFGTGDISDGSLYLGNKERVKIFEGEEVFMLNDTAGTKPIG